MIRVDRSGIPTLVQEWSEAYGARFLVRLFNDQYIQLDMYAVRDASLLGYHNWDAEADAMAIDHYISTHIKRFL